METVLSVVAVMLGVVVLGAVVTALLVRAAVRRRLRVATGVRSLAPSSWLLGLTSPARLHLRLRTATARARFEAARPGVEAAGLTDVAAQLERYATEVERSLISASQTPRTARRSSLRPVAEQVAAVEARAQHLAEVSLEWQHTMSSDAPLGHRAGPLHQVDDRLTATGHAVRDVRSSATGNSLTGNSLTGNSATGNSATGGPDPSGGVSVPG